MSTKTKEKIKVPQEVFDGLEFVRKSGKTNMLDYHMVMKIAFDEGYFTTVTNYCQKANDFNRWMNGNI